MSEALEYSEDEFREESDERELELFLKNSSAAADEVRRQWVRQEVIALAKQFLQERKFNEQFEKNCISKNWVGNENNGSYEYLVEVAGIRFKVMDCCVHGLIVAFA